VASPRGGLGWTCPPTFARGRSWNWYKSDDFLQGGVGVGVAPPPNALAMSVDPTAGHARVYTHLQTDGPVQDEMPPLPTARTAGYTASTGCLSQMNPPRVGRAASITTWCCRQTWCDKLSVDRRRYCQLSWPTTVQFITPSRTELRTVLRHTRHKTGHFGRRSSQPISWLGTENYHAEHPPLPTRLSWLHVTTINVPLANFFQVQSLAQVPKVSIYPDFRRYPNFLRPQSKLGRRMSLGRFAHASVLIELRLVTDRQTDTMP